MPKDFLSILDFHGDDLDRCLALAAQVKAERPLRAAASASGALRGAHVAMLFEKPSLRTRVTFEVAVHELGGEVIHLPEEVALGSREPVADVARNLERWVDAIVIRTFAQAILVEFAAAAPRLHVINALSDQEHPCQALADFLTLSERWDGCRGRTLAFVGDGNNVAASLVQAGLMLGVRVHIASPEDYELPSEVAAGARASARYGGEVQQFRDPRAAVKGADAVYTDVWTSMGQEAEARARRQIFSPYQVNAELMACARPGALFMHCLPAHRGEEVAAEVMDSPVSVVFDQAENRLHTQKALLLMLLAGDASRRWQA
jgi:ornithine carbamoyltransferase